MLQLLGFKDPDIFIYENPGIFAPQENTEMFILLFDHSSHIMFHMKELFHKLRCTCKFFFLGEIQKLTYLTRSLTKYGNTNLSTSRNLLASLPSTACFSWVLKMVLKQMDHFQKHVNKDKKSSNSFNN